MKRTHYLALIGALLVALMVRIPGIFWGYNFPLKWPVHHIDEWTHLVNAEILIAPQATPAWRPYYPKGMAAHVAVPVIGIRAITGRLDENPPEPISIVVVGRVINVLYGVATIFVLFLLSRRLFQDPRIAILAAWLFALGGLHVTQSHFFVADVPALFWLLLGLYLSLGELETPDKNKSQFLMGAGFCFGVAFGIKLVIVALPTLAVLTMLRQPRFLRAIQAAIFFLAGFVIVNFASYTPSDFYRSMTQGTNDPYDFSRLSGLVLYLVELPSIVSLPIFLLATGGGLILVRKLFLPHTRARLLPLMLVVIVPVMINLWLVLFKLDHFPRHLLPFIPWISLLASWSLVRLADTFDLKGFTPVLLIIPVIAYLACFIYDGEKVFLDEPRNKAARWLLRNVAQGTQIYWYTPDFLKQYRYVHFPEQGRPPFLVMQMDRENHNLSGVGWRDSYPRNYRTIFDSESQTRVDSIQAVFKRISEYREVARFKEGYFMPEYVFADRLLGDRSRSYVAEIVIFARDGEPSMGQASSVSVNREIFKQEP